MTVLASPRFKRFVLGREVDDAETTRTDLRTDRDQTLSFRFPAMTGSRQRPHRELSKHSQAELTAIETYERSHKERLEVFDKLRYLRGPEPLPDYDTLSVEQILAGLEGADTGELQRTRLYERKFQRRPDVLEPVAAALHEKSPPRAHRG